VDLFRGQDVAQDNIEVGYHGVFYKTKNKKHKTKNNKKTQKKKKKKNKTKKKQKKQTVRG